MTTTNESNLVTPQASGLGQAFRTRLAGPGGCYNVGNALCLGVSIALPALAMTDQGVSGAEAVVSAAVQTLAGNPSAVALTVATGIFFWSGEIYHRAWAQGAPPDAALNRRGDFLSGVGCMAFGVAMMGFGQPLLAAAAGVLQSFGKFGSAAGRTSLPGWPAGWPDLFRVAVLVSRVPAVLAALIGLLGALLQPDPLLGAVLGPATLLVAIGLWARADLLLFAPPASAPARRPLAEA